MHNTKDKIKMGNHRKPSALLNLSVDGKTVTAHEGDSVHAALVAAGIRQLRHSKNGEPRGVFCGMGICYECLVTIDGKPDQRACMTRAQDGMTVTTHQSEQPA